MQGNGKIRRTLGLLVTLGLVAMHMMIMIPYDPIDAQLNSEPSSTQKRSIQSLDNQDKFLTKINIGNPVNIAVNPETNMVYVDHGYVFSVINGTTNEVAIIDTFGTSPAFIDNIAVNPKTNMVYVGISPASDPASLIVINGTTNEFVGNITIGGSTLAMAVNPETNMVYFSHFGYLPSGHPGVFLSVINGTTNELVKSITMTGAVKDIAVNPKTNIMYLLNGNEITVINGSDNRVVANIANITTSDNELGEVDVNPQTNLVYVTNHLGNRISVINGTTNDEIKTIVRNYTRSISDTGADVNAELAVDTSTNLVYVVATSFQVISSNIVSVIDGTTNDIVSNFIIEARSTEDLAVNPKTNMVYATSQFNNMISVINGKKEIMLAADDITTNEQDTVPGIKVEQNPIDIAVNPETNMIYVIYSTSNIVSVIDGDTNSIMDSITVGTPPSAIDVNPFTNTIYVTNHDFDSLIAIDGATNTIAGNITISGAPQDLAINPETNMVYTFNYDPGNYPEYQNVSISAIDGTRNIEAANLPILNASTWALDTNTKTIYVPNTRNVTEIAIGTSSNEEDLVLRPDRVGLSMIANKTVMVVNPITNLLYVEDGYGYTVSEVDPYKETITNNFRIPGSVRNIAVNPVSNTVYVTNGWSNNLTIINLKANVTEDVKVGVNPWALAFNPNTNMIYVTNYDSNTVSVINSHTNKVMVGLTVNINPSNAGFIECNGQTMSDNHTTVYDFDTTLECEAKAAGGFQFSSWSGDLISTTSDNNPKTIFTASKYGALSANFNNPVQITIPWELLAGIILAPIVGWVVPFIADRSRENKQRKNLAEFMMKNIDDELGKPPHDIVEYQEHLEELRKKIQEMYIEGKISESSYERLNNKVSDYEDKNM